jgi:hypothetical protein
MEASAGTFSQAKPQWGQVVGVPVQAKRHHGAPNAKLGTAHGRAAWQSSAPELADSGGGAVLERPTWPLLHAASQLESGETGEVGRLEGPGSTGATQFHRAIAQTRTVAIFS